MDPQKNHKITYAHNGQLEIGFCVAIAGNNWNYSFVEPFSRKIESVNSIRYTGKNQRIRVLKIRAQRALLGVIKIDSTVSFKS